MLTQVTHLPEWDTRATNILADQTNKHNHGRTKPTKTQRIPEPPHAVRALGIVLGLAVLLSEPATQEKTFLSIAPRLISPVSWTLLPFELIHFPYNSLNCAYGSFGFSSGFMSREQNLCLYISGFISFLTNRPVQCVQRAFPIRAHENEAYLLRHRTD